MQTQAIDTIAHAYARLLSAQKRQDKDQAAMAHEFISGATTGIASVLGNENAASILVAGYNAGQAIFNREGAQ